MVIRKCQGQAILLCYEPNLLYPSDLQHVIKSWGMKITSQSASVHYNTFAITVFYCTFIPETI